MVVLALLFAASSSAHPFHPSKRPAAVVKHWQRQHRWLAKYRPFVYPSGRRFAAPYPVALCESGERYDAGPYGAYGLIFEPPWQTPREQDEDAYRLLHTVGVYNAWRRWEIEQGCPY